MNINDKLTNNLTGYLLDAKNVKGGYIVVDTYNAFNTLPVSTIVLGSLAWCQTSTTINNIVYSDGFYQYNGSTWVKVNFALIEDTARWSVELPINV